MLEEGKADYLPFLLSVMGRKIPLADDPSLSIHQALSFSLLLAGMAAAVAVSTTLCGIRFGKKSETKDSPSNEGDGNLTFNTPSSPSASTSPSETTKTAGEEASVKSQDGKENEVPGRMELPLPPAKQLREAFSCNNFMTKSASTRQFAKNMSMKMPRSMSMARRDHHREDKYNQKKKAKAKHEDSVWMKTIILGEKCKRRNEDEPEIYDANGDKISANHRKSTSSVSISTQSSFGDVNAVASQEGEKKVTKKEEEEVS